MKGTLEVPVTIPDLDDTVDVLIDLNQLTRKQKALGLALRNANREKLATVYVHRIGITVQRTHDEHGEVYWHHYDSKEDFVAAGLVWSTTIDNSGKRQGPELSFRADARAEAHGGIETTDANVARYLVACRDALVAFWNSRVRAIVVLKGGEKILIDMGNNTAPFILSTAEAQEIDVLKVVKGIYSTGSKPVGEDLVRQIEHTLGQRRPPRSELEEASKKAGTQKGEGGAGNTKLQSRY